MEAKIMQYQSFKIFQLQANQLAQWQQNNSGSYLYRFGFLLSASIQAVLLSASFSLGLRQSLFACFTYVKSFSHSFAMSTDLINGLDDGANHQSTLSSIHGIVIPPINAYFSNLMSVSINN